MKDFWFTAVGVLFTAFTVTLMLCLVGTITINPEWLVILVIGWLDSAAAMGFVSYRLDGEDDPTIGGLGSEEA